MTADTATSVNFAMSRNVFAKHFDVGIRFPDLLNEIVLGLAQLVMSVSCHTFGIHHLRADLPARHPTPSRTRCNALGLAY